MLLVIRHYPDKKRPCICLEDGNKGVIIGYLTNEERENWLKQAFGCGDNQTIAITTPNTIFDEESGERKRGKVNERRRIEKSTRGNKERK